MGMLWRKFILGLMFFELVSILFAIVPDYGNEYMTKENKNWNSFKNVAPKLNLSHNRYMNCVSALDYITLGACWAEPFTEIYCFDSLQSTFQQMLIIVHGLGYKKFNQRH